MSASFTIVDGQTVTAQQTLNAGESGVIDSGGQLNVANTAITNPGGQANVTVTNNGSISTSTHNDHGINIRGNTATVTNNGSITVVGNSAAGIHLFSSNNHSVSNTGSIRMSGANGEGIEVDSVSNSTINNSGNITVTGTQSRGIFALSGGNNNNIYINSGTITTTGINSTGIGASGNNETIINTGTISSTGNTGKGIQAGGTNITTTNSGTISVSGTSGIGVELNGTNNTLNNTGTIIATGNATQAIVGGGNASTLNLLSGSKIIGTIDLGGGTDTLTVSGANNSSIMTILNAETITLNVPGAVNGNVVTTVDPTGQSAQGVALSSLTNAFHGVISQRMAQTQALPPIQLASLELSSGMLFQERAPIVWGEVFGSHRTRGNDGLALAHTHDYKGFTGGYEQDYRNGRLGVFAGFADANVSTEVTSISTETDSFFAGVYGLLHLGKVNLTTSLAAGVEDHDNNRTVVDNLAGTETARSDFNSVFFSPSVTLSSAYTFNTYFELRPSATLNYNVAWYNSYNETGTTRSNLTIDDRTAQSLNGRLQLAVAMALNDTSEFELRSGFTTRHTFDSDTDASLSGASFQYSSAGDDSVQGGFVGGNLRFNTTDRLDVVADVEYREASGDESEITGRLRLEYLF